jgi:hypothetical protein
VKDTDPPPLSPPLPVARVRGPIEFLDLQDKIQHNGGRVYLFRADGMPMLAGTSTLLACWSDHMDHLMRMLANGEEDAGDAWSVDGLLGVAPKQHLYLELPGDGNRTRLVATHLHWFQRMDPVFREAHVLSITSPNAKFILTSNALNGWKLALFRPA